MPNWCNNHLRVIGNTKDLRKFFDDTTVVPTLELGQPPKDVEPYLDLTIPFPCPAELKNTTASFGHPQDDAHDAQMKSNVEKYGHTDWYEWQIANWGTKWAPSDIFVDRYSDTSVMMRFDSAWSPPTELIKKLSSIYTNLAFILSFEEGGMGFLGVESYCKGETIWAEGGDWDGYPQIKKHLDSEDDDAWDEVVDAVWGVLNVFADNATDALLEEFPEMARYNKAHCNN